MLAHLKSAPNHPGKPLHPQATWEKSAPNHLGKPLHTPHTIRAMPIWKQHISKRGFPEGDEGAEGIWLYGAPEQKV